MRSRLILNPSSGTDKAPDYLPSINQALRERFGAMEIVMTIGARDAEAAAVQAVKDGCSRVFVAGGDGTLNEVVNGLVQAEATETTTIGLLPLGTGNDFARMLSLSEKPEEAVAAMYDERERRVDIGLLNGRAFINASGGGFISEVTDVVDDRLKSIAGKLAFLIGGAQVVLDYEPASVRVSVPEGDFRGCSFECEEDQAEGEGWRVDGGTRVLDTTLHMFAVCNARQIGGGRLIAPHARIDDGWLDVCLVDEMPTLEFITLLGKVAAGGSHLGDPRVRYFRVKSLEMAFDRPIKVNTDGELLEAQTCRYALMAGSARFLVGEVAENP